MIKIPVTTWAIDQQNFITNKYSWKFTLFHIQTHEKRSSSVHTRCLRVNRSSPACSSHFHVDVLRSNTAQWNCGIKINVKIDKILASYEKLSYLLCVLKYKKKNLKSIKTKPNKCVCVFCVCFPGCLSTFITWFLLLNAYLCTFFLFGGRWWTCLTLIVDRMRYILWRTQSFYAIFGDMHCFYIRTGNLEHCVQQQSFLYKHTTNVLFFIG